MKLSYQVFVSASLVEKKTLGEGGTDGSILC